MADDELFRALQISSAGMKVQGTRLRVISENIANADSLPTEPGGQPYRRKQITFKNALDRQVGIDLVQIDKIRTDPGEFGLRFDPHHPAANANGYVSTPNVNTLIEVMDMREAQRSYQANLNVLRSSRRMMSDTIQLLRR